MRGSLRALRHSVQQLGRAANGQQAPQNTANSKRRRFEAVSKVVQQLPVEAFASKEDLQQLPLLDLKVGMSQDIDFDQSIEHWLLLL